MDRPYIFLTMPYTGSYYSNNFGRTGLRGPRRDEGLQCGYNKKFEGCF